MNEKKVPVFQTLMDGKDGGKSELGMSEYKGIFSGRC